LISILQEEDEIKENLPETDMWSVKPASADKWAKRIGMINILFRFFLYSLI
jgi:hypothetical protein